MSSKRRIELREPEAYVGDLHLNGPLGIHIADYDTLVLKSLENIIKDCKAKGIRRLTLLGDVFHGYTTTVPTYTALFTVLNRYRSMQFVIIGGNHDAEANPIDQPLTQHALAHAYHAQAKMLPHVKVYLYGAHNEEPSHGVPGVHRYLPWPLHETEEDRINVVHLDAKGSSIDNGKASLSTWETDCFCVSGHLHGRQKVRNTYWPGAPCQTSFGEDLSTKGYLIVRPAPSAKDSYGLAAEFVDIEPAYTLRTAHVSSIEEYNLLCEAIRSSPPNCYYRVIVDVKNVVLPDGAFDAYSKVIRTNKFRTKRELAAAEEDYLLPPDETDPHLSLNDALLEWLTVNGLADSEQDDVLDALNSVL